MREAARTSLLAILGGRPALSSRPQPPPLGEEAIAALTAALRSGPLSTFHGGFEVAELEREFAGHFGAAHAVACSSGSAALHAALLACGAGPGDEVILSPFSCVPPVNVVLQTGARPVFADIDPRTLVLDPESVRDKLSARTRAVLPVHFHGYPVDVVALERITRPAGVALIGDCCMGYGARTADGRAIGAVEDFGCFSLHTTKLVSAGQGGMILTSSAERARELRQITTYGMNEAERFVRFGLNYVMPQPLAALGRTSLRALDVTLVDLRRHSELLHRSLAGLPVTTVADPSYASWTPQAFSLILPRELAGLRDRVLAALMAENVPVTVPVVEPLYRLPFVPDGDSPHAEDVCRRFLTVFHWPGCTDFEVAAIADAIGKVFGNLRDLRRLVAAR